MISIKVSEYMTKSPHTVGQEQSLSRAHEIMRKYTIRHLPVLHGGNLVGVVSLQDLDLTESLKDVDVNSTTVEEAMTIEPYIVPADKTLREVVEVMVEKKIGSTIVGDRNEVLGVFTAVDAMRALRDLLSR